MNVLAYVPYPFVLPWFNTDLEVIQTHLDQGDDVTVLGCNADFPACDANPTHDLIRCLHCMGRRVKGLAALSRPVLVRPVIDLTDAQRREIAAARTRFDTIEELEDYAVEAFDVGWAVLASLVWLTRDAYPCLRHNEDLIRDLVHAALGVYRSVQNHLARQPVERVYLFTGKHALLRAALRACQSRGVDCYIEEIGRNFRYYELYPNVLPHDIPYTVRRIREQWERAADDPQREETATRFYEQRAQGVTQGWYSFVTEQKAGLLPPGWDPAKKNIGVFSSSEDEFRGIGREWLGPLYENQVEGLRRLSAAFADPAAGYHVYLRIHPNLKGVHNDHEDAIRGLRAENLTVIQPEDEISSYALMRSADKVVTFGSTTGIEAAFWGKPSLLAGQSMYRDLDATYNPKTHDELVALLRQELPPKDRTGALMFGYYYMSFGQPFRHLAPEDPHTAKFRGDYVRADKWYGRAAKLLGVVPPLHRWMNDQSRAAARRRLTGGHSR